MLASRPLHRVRLFSGFLVGSSLVVTGCDSGAPKTGTSVYSSPEEIKAKNEGLKDAMKGGAYGSAGRKASQTFNP